MLVVNNPAYFVIDDNNSDYLQNYLKKQINKRARIECLIGTNITRYFTGSIIHVGKNFIVLKDIMDNLIVADVYSIKFIKIYKSLS